MQFQEDNASAIANHESAKEYFDQHGYGYNSGNRLPSIKDLRGEYAKHESKKKILWGKYHQVRTMDKDADNAWKNVKAILNLQVEQTTPMAQQNKSAMSR